jgi:hypothetical protein
MAATHASRSHTLHPIPRFRDSGEIELGNGLVGQRASGLSKQFWCGGTDFEKRRVRFAVITNT